MLPWIISKLVSLSQRSLRLLMVLKECKSWSLTTLTSCLSLMTPPQFSKRSMWIIQLPILLIYLLRFKMMSMVMVLILWLLFLESFSAKLKSVSKREFIQVMLLRVSSWPLKRLKNYFKVKLPSKLKTWKMKKYLKL